jgi:hypothetical protein
MNAFQMRDLPRSLAVFDRAGQFVQRVSRERALTLLSKPGAVMGSGEGVIRLVAPDTRVYPAGKMRRSRTSHNRETADNPQGVWTLVRISPQDASIYTRVRDECLKAA